MRISLLLFVLFSFSLPAFSQSNPGKTLDRDSLIADVDLLQRAMKELHPGIYRYNTEAQFDQAFDRLRNRIDNDPTEAEFVILLAQTVATIRCGHTYVNPWNMKRSIRARLFGSKAFFPLGFEILNDRFYVTHTSSARGDIPVGAEILAINGIPINTVYDSLKTIARTDGNNTAAIADYLSLQEFAENSWEPFDIYFPMFFPLETPVYKIRYQHPLVSNPMSVTLFGLSKGERARRISYLYGPKSLEQEKWTLDTSDPTLAVMRLGTFATWNWKDFNAEAWFAEAFAEIKAKGITNLAIDIRGNSGGLAEPKIALLRHLTDKKLPCEPRQLFIRTTHINPDFQQYIDTWERQIFEPIPESLYKKAKDGRYEFFEPSECEWIEPIENSFDGKVFILANGSNVSATSHLLERARENNMATIVGQTAGGNRQGINGGSFALFYLPHSGMEVDIPLKHFAPRKAQPDAGVAPDIEVEVTREDLIKGREPYLKAVRQHLR